MTQFLATPVDKSLGVTGSWQDIDLFSDIPSSATGAIFEVVNTHASTPYQYGLRKKGSTDDRHKDAADDSHYSVIVGVDATRKCQGYIESTDVDFYLVGYTKEDITLNTNGTDKSLSTTLAWTDIDLSGELPSGAVAAIFEVVNTNATSAYNWGLRKKGSSDNRYETLRRNTHCFMIIGVDATRKCQGYIDSTVVDFFLMGYLTAGQAETNGVDRSLGSTGAYVDITESGAPTGATGAFGEVLTISIAKYAVRKNGTSHDYYYDVDRHYGFFVGLDANKKWEGKIENTVVDFFTLGYFDVGYLLLSGAINAVSSITGELSIQRKIAGVVPASSSVTGLLGLHRPIAGAITTTSSVSGDLSKTKALIGSINAVSTIEGDLTGTWLLAGSTDVATSVTGKLSAQWSLLSEIPASSSVTGSLELDIQLLASTNFGISNYAGPTGAIIAYPNLTDSMVCITSIADPPADVGETYIGSTNPNSLIVYNSGHGRSEFRWAIPNNPYGKGDSTFAGPGGQTVTHTKGDTDYVPCIIPSANGNGAIGEWWITDIANTSFVVRNSGSGLPAFKWAIPRFGTGGKGASSFAGSGGVIITHNLNISGGYTPLIIPTENPNGHLGAVYVTDITTNSFTVKNTGSAITTFMWLISEPTRGIVADSDVFGVLGRGLPLTGAINSLSTVAGSLSRTRQLAGEIASLSELTGELCFVAATQGFYYAKLGTDNLHNPPETSFNITTELNNIASFDYMIQNDAVNRAIIANNLTDDFSIMRDDGRELLRGSIDSDSIEYFTEGEGRGRRRIHLSGFANFVDLKYLIYKRMGDGDAEPVGSVQDEDKSTSTFTDYTTEANNVTINDVLLTFGAVNDALYIGKDETFFAAKIKYSTKGIQAANTTVVMEYSKGSGVWATLDCIDESYGFTKDAGTYLLYIPNKADDWAKDTINGKNQYHIRFRLTEGSYSTLPKLDQIKVSNADVCRVQFNDTPADTILGYLLEGTGYTEDATDQCPSTEITIRGEYDSKLRWIYGLGSALTWEDVDGDMQRYDCWIDTSKKVHYKQHRGTDQGDISANFRALRNKLGYEEMGTRIFSTGGQEGINQKKAIVEDLTAQGEHKLREIVLEDHRITAYEEIKKEALKSLANRKDPLKDVTGDLDTKYWLDKIMDVGDKILVHQPDWNLNNQELYVMRAVIGPSVTKLDLGNSQIHLEHLRSTLQRQMDIGNVWMHGSVSTYVVGPEEDNYERKDGTTAYPLRFTIETPDDTRAINHVEIGWTLMDYQSSVTGSGEGGGHDHTAGLVGSDGAHYHGEGPTGYEGSHDHNTNYSGGHGHTGSIDGSHWHSISGSITWTEGAAVVHVYATYSAGEHSHSNPTTASQGTHEHGVLITTSSDAPDNPHSHTVNGDTGGAGAHSHTQGATGSEGDHFHASGTLNGYFVSEIDSVTAWTSSTHMGHNHPITDEPDHGHVINFTCDHQHTVPNSTTEPAHNHGGSDISSAPAHDHTLAYGLHDEAGGGTLELYVGDELVGNAYVGDQSGINITGWITKGSNSITLQPKVGNNVKGRAKISAICTCFLENLK